MGVLCGTIPEGTVQRLTRHSIGLKPRAYVPGSKEATWFSVTWTDTPQKRRAQNRAAQRAFRERKEKHTRELEQQCAIKDAKYRELQKHDEARYRGLEKAHEAERREFEQKYAELEQRNETLEQLLLMTNEGRTCDPKALCEIVQGKARGRKMTIISKADRK